MMTNDQQVIIDKTAAHVKELFTDESTGHDWWHIYRVWQSAQHIGEKEGADAFVVALGALLHDIADWKFHDGDESVGPRVASEWLESLSVDQETIEHVAEIILHISYKGATTENKIETLEGRVVQDADRLDALGAIGIARAFAYGGAHDRLLHNPNVQPKLHGNFEEYKNSKSTTINHFHEKLLLLKDKLNTDTGKALAAQRHRYMEQFLEQFQDEWDGKA